MSISSKAKIWSLTHVISYVTLATTDITYNSLFFYFLHLNNAFSTLNIFFNALVNVAYAVGMYYYATKISITASGLQETTTTPSETSK